MDLFRKSLLLPVFIIALTAGILFCMLLIRGIIESLNTPDLKTWHRSGLFKEEFSYSTYKNINEYLEQEKLFFNKTYKLLEEVNNTDPKYLKGSIYNPHNNNINHNRSSVTYPAIKKYKGSALVVHGLSDSPYHMNHIVKILQKEGYYIINLRLPGHGTAPGALTDIKWQDWMRAVEFGVDMAYRKINDSSDKKFILVGFSTGGALLLRYIIQEIRAVGDRLPDKLFLFSPAVSITKQAYFADFHEYVSWLPGLEKFKWMDVLKENDPYKYQSFPKNAANQIYKLTESNKKLVNKLVRAPHLKLKVPPIITFQSPYDATVEYEGLKTLLYKIDNEKNKLILFKKNSKYIGLYNELYKSVIKPEDYASDKFKSELYIIKNITETDSQCGLFRVVIDKNGRFLYSQEENYPLIPWSDNVFAMSHISPQISISDPYYGKGSDIFPFQTGKFYGERGILKDENTETFERIRFNPFIDIVSRFLEMNL